MTTVSIAAAKSRFSELIAKSGYTRERFIITRRNKPVAALVSLEDLKIIEQHEERQGLASIIGKWKGFEEVGEQISDLPSLRKDSGTRKNVSLRYGRYHQYPEKETFTGVARKTQQPSEESAVYLNDYCFRDSLRGI